MIAGPVRPEPTKAARLPPPATETLRADQRERRERIVAVAVRSMVAEEYERIQIKDVAESAEVALGTLYRYFVSKEHLFGEALVAWADGFGDALANRPASGAVVDRVKTVYRLAARAFERQPLVYNAMIAIQASGDPRASQAFERFAERQNAAFEGVLDRIPAERRRDVVLVMGAVLDQNLRNWRLGRQPIAAVYESIDRAAELILRR